MVRPSLTLALFALAAPVATLSAQNVPVTVETSPVQPPVDATVAPPTNNPIIWSAGEWDLFEAQKLKFCALRLGDRTSGTILGMMQTGRGPVWLRFRPGADGEMFDKLDLRMGAAAFAVPLSIDGSYVHYLLSGTAAEVFGPMTRAEVLEVAHGGQPIARVALDGIDEALAQLATCAAQWPDEQLSLPLYAQPNGPQRPPIPEPDLAGPFDPWQDPRPLGKAHWFLPDDYPPFSVKMREEGRVVVAVTVSAEGRATSCKVRKPSGYARLDEAACAGIITRARFQPATDVIGERAASTMVFPVNWHMPEQPPEAAPAGSP